MAQQKLPLPAIAERKKRGEKITMLTAYDYPLASVLDEAGIDIILVGDSAANVVWGLDSTKDMPMDLMIHHVQAVRRGASRAWIIGDMPYVAYQKDPREALMSARRFMEEGGCDGVKVEWFSEALSVVRRLVAAQVPVMGHIGLTPQTVDQLGGFKVQGKDVASARALVKEAKALEEAGCFSLVLECVPDRVAQWITKELSIPTIGIGAGVHCDGQVLVTHDLVGLFERFRPKFVKPYANIRGEILAAVKMYRAEVCAGTFPGAEQSFTIRDEEFKKIQEAA